MTDKSQSRDRFDVWWLANKRRFNFNNKVSVAAEAWQAALADQPAVAENDEEEVYKIGVRDGYEAAIQDLDCATGGDGEFVGSTSPGETVDLEVMKQRIIDRCVSDDQPAVAGAAGDEVIADLSLRVYAILREYKLSNAVDQDGYWYPLVDAVSEDGKSIATGEVELHYIADEIAAALRTAAPSPAVGGEEK